jgi:hypothetical protein
MSLGRPARGGEVHESAVERLRVAQDDQARLRRVADVAQGTPVEDVASADLSEAGERLAASEAWLIWIERGF